MNVMTKRQCAARQSRLSGIGVWLMYVAMLAAGIGAVSVILAAIAQLFGVEFGCAFSVCFVVYATFYSVVALIIGAYRAHYRSRHAS